METSHTHTETKTTRGAAVNALAIVGFIALILLGMGLAIYAARFVPVALSGIGQAAVSLSGIFDPNDDNVIVIDEPTYPADPNVVSVPIATSTSVAETPEAPASPAPVTGGPSYVAPSPTYSIVTVGSEQLSPSRNYYGDPDLTVEIIAMGYLRRDGDANSFVEASSVPDNREGAVKFRIRNRGTDESERTSLDIIVENSRGSRTTERASVPAIPPGMAIDGVGSFDARASGDTEIRLEIDPRDTVDESNERNNDDEEEIRVRS